MYELAKKSREAMKAKARRLAGEKDAKVDSSNWTPAPPLNAEKKTGLQPTSGARNFNKGGKVVGKAEGCESAMRADRKPRKCGGRVKKNLGGVMEVLSPAYGLARAIQRGGKDEERDTAERAKGAMMQTALSSALNPPRKNGGKVKKASGGSLPSPQEAMDSEARTKGIRVTDTKMPKPEEAAARSGKAPQDVPARKSGGKVRAKKEGGGWIDNIANALAGKGYIGGASWMKDDETGSVDVDREPGMDKLTPAQANRELAMGRQNMRKSGGKAEKREGRATGGRTKSKGKTNINIAIMAGGKAPEAAPMAGAPAGPGAVPVPMPAPAPAAPPPAAMPIPVPMQGGQPPMPRKRGGRVYSSYKDMDAGAATGEGRLEKTEIQKKKRRA